MKALIITYYWPPAGGSGVQRWLKFVKYLRDFDIEPVVYTVQDPVYAITDVNLQNDIPEGIEVVQQPIWEPNNLVSLFGSKKKKTSAGFLNPNPSFIGKVAQYIRANYFIPDARKFWIKPSVKYLTNYLQNNKIDVVISTGPPHSAHLIGLKLKETLNIKWIADFRDPWTEIDYLHQLPLTKKAIKKHQFFENAVLKKADHVLVVGETMARNFRKITKSVSVISNGYDTFTSKSNAGLDSTFSLVHIGLMNSDRNHQILWQSLKALCDENADFKNDLQLKFIGAIADDVEHDIQKYQLKNNTELISYVPHNEVLQYQQSAQVLLLAVNNVPSAKGIITGKIFEYLQANRPILAIAPIDGDLNGIIKNTETGVVIGFNDLDKLKKEILKLYTSFKIGNLKVSPQNIEQYHRKALTNKLAGIINQLIE